MSYQPIFGFSTDTTYPVTKQEEKKTPHKSSDNRLSVTVNPLFSKASTSPKSLQKREEEESPSRVIKKESSSEKPVKTVTQAFGDVHRSSKRSVGGSSLQPILPHSKSGHFSVSKTEDKVSQITPRIKESRTLRTPSITTHSFSQPLPSSLEDIQTTIHQLNEFTHLFHSKVKLIQQRILQPSNEQTQKQEEEEEDLQTELAFQMLSNGLSDEWIALREELDMLLLGKERTDSNEDMEENSNYRSITLHNLGLDHQLDTPSPLVTSSKKSSFNKASISQAKKSLKEEKHLKIAFNFMISLLLDLQLTDPWSQKNNIKVMTQFIPGSFKIEQTLPNVAFAYINQLFLLGVILKQGSHNIDKLTKSHNIFAQLPIEYAHKFLKAIKEIKELKKLDKEPRKEKLDLYCYQYGSTVTSYAKSLLVSLSDYIEKTEMKFDLRNIYNIGLASQVEKDMIKRMLNYCEGFQADFERAVRGKFLHLTSDKEECKIPKNTRKVRADKTGAHEYLQYCHGFLDFLIQNLDIQKESVSILELLQETKSLASVYEELEKKWQTLKKTDTEAKLDGAFKLLPILRIFNQNNLLAIHKAMYMMQKVVENLDPDTKSNIQIATSYPTAETKIDKEKPGHMLDRETKHIEIAFEGNKVSLIVKRLNALSYSQITPDKDYYFGDCPIHTSFIISAPIDDMQQWTVEEQSVKIGQPVESDNLLFLHRYSLMITILEAMGIEYHH